MDWQLRLTDAMSGPALRIAAALATVEDRINRVNRALAAAAPATSAASNMKSLTRAHEQAERSVAGMVRRHDQAEASLGRLGEAMKSASGAGSGFGGQAELLMKLAQAATATATAIVALGVAFAGTVLQAVDFRRRTLGALEILMKSKVGAQQAWTVGINLATRFNLNPQETLAGVHEMISKGFSAQDSKVVLTAMADLKVLSPKANIEKAMLAITQIKGKPKLGLEELNGQLADAGLETVRVASELGKKLGKSNEEIMKMISAGKITNDQGIWAIMKAIETMGGGKLGDAAEKAAQKSLGGLLEGIKTRMGFIPLAMAQALDNSAGVEAVMGAMRNVIQAIDPTKSAAMKGLVSAASTFADTLFKVLFGEAAGAGGGKALEGVITRVTTLVRGLTSIVATVGPLVVSFAAGFMEGMRDVFDVLSEVASSMGGFGGDMTTAAGLARQFGRALGWVVGGAVMVAGAVAATSAAVVGFVTAVASGIPAMLLVVTRGVATVGHGLDVVGGWFARAKSWASAVLPLAAIWAALGSLVQRAGAIVLAVLSSIGGAIGGVVQKVGGWAAAALAPLLSLGNTLFSALQGVIAGLMTAGTSMGTNLWAGFVQGIEAGIARVTDAGTRLADAAKSAVSTSLIIQSPSRVMAEMGGYTAQGFAQGVDGGAGQVDASMRALVAPPAPVLPALASTRGAAAGAGGSFSVSVGPIYVAGHGGDDEAKGDDLGQRIAEKVRDMLEDMLAQSGAGPQPA